MLWWALGILGLSASISCNSEFFYSQNIVRRSDECNPCFEKDCFTLDKARCDYYAEADSILPKDVEIPGGDEDAAKRKEVDDLMFDLVDKRLSSNMECIPYVSRYTNCNKDNVCLDCKTCSCSPKGKWLCTTTVPCHSQNPLNVDHRVLVMVMTALKDSCLEEIAECDKADNYSPSKKTKRAVTDYPEITASTITLEKLSEWLYGAKPLHVPKISPNGIPTTEFSIFVDDEPFSEIATTVTAPNSVVAGLTTTESTTGTTTSEDNDYIAFDEVLRSIAVDPKPYNRRKPLDNELLDNIKNKTISIDYMMMDEDNSKNGTANDHLGDVINFMLDYDDVVTETAVTNATEVVIDLLPAGNLANVNITEDNIIYNKDLDPNFFDKTNDILEYNAINIMKRDVTGQENITAANAVPTVTIIVNTTNTTTNNKTVKFPELKDNVLIPLNKIISDKIRELESLQRIKEDLLKFVKSNNHPEDIIEEKNSTSKTSFSIYNIVTATGLDVDLRRANPSRYEKYMIKLKSDIFAVLRDMSVIQRYKTSEIPDDLKLLMHAMKRYVYENQLAKKPKRPKLGRQKSFRRMMEQASRCDRISFKDCLVHIIEVIDKDTPISNALSALSPVSRKIMKHIIKTYYVNQHVMPGLRAHDPHYNLTNYLNSIGNKWQQVSAILIHSTPFESLHRMKLLHCTLTLDISKLHDAIGIIDFARSRRMVTLIDRVNDGTLDRIDAGLSAIHNKILMFIKYYNRLPNQQVTKHPRALIKETVTKPPLPTQNDVVVTRKDKKRSFIKHIRNLLKTSKNDIAELLHRKVPKSDIVKELAKKRLDEISEKRYGEYEDTMRRWQQNLELTSRMKRSVLDQFKTRSLKNIIPRYLRHTVNPRIKENQKNATADATRKAEVKKSKRKERKGSRRGLRARMTTVSKSRKLATPKTRKVTRPPATSKSINSTILTSKTH